VPSLLHEALITLFRNEPALAADVLRDALGVALPGYSHATAQPAELTEVTPTEYRADLVIVLGARKPVLGIVVEVQLDRDDDKRWTWPTYLAALRERMRCPVCLLVVCSTEAVARWCARPIAMGPGGFELRPHVMGPAVVPVVTDPDLARRKPELSVLSAMAHGKGDEAVPVALAALAGTASLDEERSVFYTDLVLAALSAAARRALEAMMRERHEYLSDFARKYFGQGKAEGKAEGIAEGKAEGIAEGKAESLLTILSVRGLEVTHEARERILACQELEQLDEWTRRAVVAETVADVLGDREMGR
jgi:hypothetical protein